MFDQINILVDKTQTTQLKVGQLLFPSLATLTAQLLSLFTVRFKARESEREEKNRSIIINLRSLNRMMSLFTSPQCSKAQVSYSVSGGLLSDSSDTQKDVFLICLRG